MGAILVFSERDDVAFELLTKGREFSATLGLPLAAAILGDKVAAKVGEFFAYGAERVFVGEDARLAEFHVDVYAEALYQVAQAADAELVLVGSTRRGKDLASRVAQKLGAGCVTDAIGLDVRDGKVMTQRYALGGNTVASEMIISSRKVIAVMPKTFEVGAKQARSGEATMVTLKLADPRTKIVERRPKVSEMVNIEAAETLIAIGKGLAKQEDLALIEALAKVLRGEIGCTRALSSDYHWLSEERMIGISGKRCKPKLHISIGVSGQIQHTVGILSSKLIVAINKDKAAPIFGIADYGIVGDLYEVVPKLTEKLRGETR
jgi:electron transfer flavoprotein alpha subunit